MPSRQFRNTFGLISRLHRILFACSLVALTTSAALHAQDESAVEALAGVLAAADARRYDAAVLIAGARHPERAVRRRAALAMGQIGNSAALPTLIEMLEDRDTLVQQDAAFAIGLLRDPDAIPRLRELALNTPPDRQTLTHAETVAALARIGGREVEAFFAELLGRWTGQATSAEAPLTVREALGVAWRLGAGAPVAAMLPFVQSPVREFEWRTIYSLARIQAPGAANALIRATDHRDPLMRSLAIRALTARYADTTGIERAAFASRAKRLANDVDPHVRINALRALGTFASPEHASVAIDRISDSDVNVRVQALLAVGELGGPNAGAALRARLTDRVLAVRRQALLSLARIEKAGALPDIGAWVTSTEWPVRRIAAEALGATASDSALAWLETLVRDADGRVVHTALSAIATIAAPRAAAIAPGLLSHQDAVVRQVAAERIATQPDTAAIGPLVAAFDRSSGGDGLEVRIAIVTALGRIGRLGFTEQAAVEDRFLASHPTCSDYLVRRAAARAFPVAAERWGPETPVETGRQIGDYRDIARTVVLPSEGTANQLVVEMDRGSFTITLLGADAPIAVWSFLQLVDGRYFDNSTWHRVVPNFVIQDGDPRGDGQGGPGFRLRDENSRRRYDRGAVGMALSGPDTGGSQFFITLSPQPHLDGTYPVIGRVDAGLDVIDRVSQGDRIRRIRRP